MIGNGHGIHWPDLDEDLSVEGLIAGRASRESHRSFKRWLQARSAGRSVFYGDLTASQASSVRKPPSKPVGRDPHRPSEASRGRTSLRGEPGRRPRKAESNHEPPANYSTQAPSLVLPATPACASPLLSPLITLPSPLPPAPACGLGSLTLGTSLATINSLPRPNRRPEAKPPHWGLCIFQGMYGRSLVGGRPWQKSTSTSTASTCTRARCATARTAG